MKGLRRDMTTVQQSLLKEIIEKHVAGQPYSYWHVPRTGYEARSCFVLADMGFLSRDPQREAFKLEIAW